MTGLSRRFEVLLPLLSNDGQPVPDSLLVDVTLEPEKQFGAVSSECQIIRGLWNKEGITFRDELIRVFVDVPDTTENRQFFVQFKDRLKSIFGQLGDLDYDFSNRDHLNRALVSETGAK